MINSPEDTATETGSFIPASQNLPEITFKAVVLALLLAVILAAANGYLGLKVGTTVSASIPAAVISMGVLRLFRRSNILENNIVQTAASAGEALVAGIAYILPALIILKYWENFHYWETVMISIIGGFLGIMFSVPLRRILLAQKVLRFPEGTAIGQVLKASVESASSLKHLVRGGLVGGLISLCQGGFQFIAGSIQFWYKAGNNFIYGIGCGFDPALIAAGYIVGINVAISNLVGIIIGWVISIPVLTHLHGVPAGSASDAAITMWRSNIRYMGVGTLLIGGIWTLITLIKPIIDGLRTSFLTVKNFQDTSKTVIRTERDLPITYVIWTTLALMIPLAFIVHHFSSNTILHLSGGMQIITIAIALVFVVCVGFALSAVSGYFAGLVGSTNSPGSALTLSSLLLFSLILLILFGPILHFTDATQRLQVAGLAIIVTAVVAAANVITNETIQDLKAGQIVGATPWKQQFMLVLGVIAAAFVIPLVLQLLFNAYGIGGVFPHPGMDPSQMLAAPQAGLMAALTQGVFTHNLPWNMLGIGGIIAVFSILIDLYLRQNNSAFSFPVLSVGLGIYLPLDSSAPLVIGGFASFFIERALKRRYMSDSAEDQHAFRMGKQRGLILACGMVAGAALMGVLLAIPFALAQSTNVLNLVSDKFAPIADVLGILVIIGLIYWFYRVTCSDKV